MKKKCERMFIEEEAVGIIGVSVFCICAKMQGGSVGNYRD